MSGRMFRAVVMVGFGVLSQVALRAGAAPESSPAFWISRCAADLDRIDSADERAGAMSYLAILQARTGDLPAMRTLLARLKDLEGRANPASLFFLRLQEIQAHSWARDDTAFHADLDSLATLRQTNPKLLDKYLVTVVVTLIDLGKFDEAATWTRFIDTPERRWNRYLKIAHAQASRGMRADYERSMQSAEVDFQLAAKKDQNTAHHDWWSLAAAAAYSGDAARVERWTVHLKPDELANAHAILAATAWNSGNREEYAAEISKALKDAARTDPTDIPFCYGAIAKTQADAGDARGVSATEALVAVGPDPARDSLRMEEFNFEMAVAYATLGDGAKAIDRLKRAQAAKAAGPKAEKPSPDAVDILPGMMTARYSPIILALADKGQLESAEAVAKMALPFQKSRAGEALAIAHARIGRPEEALRAIVGKDFMSQRQFTIELCKALVESNRFVELRAYIDALPTPRDRAYANIDVAEALLRKNANHAKQDKK